MSEPDEDQEYIRRIFINFAAGSKEERELRWERWLTKLEERVSTDTAVTIGDAIASRRRTHETWETLSEAALSTIAFTDRWRHVHEANGIRTTVLGLLAVEARVTDPAIAAWWRVFMAPEIDSLMRRADKMSKAVDEGKGRPLT